MKQQLLAVIDALEDLQATGRYTVMYSVAGHVHDFDVAIYCGKWYKGASPMFRQSIYTDRPLCRQYGGRAVLRVLLGGIGKLDLYELEAFVRRLLRAVTSNNA